LSEKVAILLAKVTKKGKIYAGYNSYQGRFCPFSQRKTREKILHLVNLYSMRLWEDEQPGELKQQTAFEFLSWRGKLSSPNSD
jgi:hypothetical protein